MRWQLTPKESPQKRADLLLLQHLTGLDCSATGVRCGEPLELVIPASKAAPGEVCYHFLETPPGVESWVRVRYGLENDRPASELLHLKSNGVQPGTILFDGLELAWLQIHREGEKQALRRSTFSVQLAHSRLVQYPLVSGVLIHDGQAVGCLHHYIRVKDLEKPNVGCK